MKLKHITLLAVASLVLAACNNPQIPIQIFATLINR